MLNTENVVKPKMSSLIKMNKSASDYRLFAVHPGGGLTVPYIPIALGLKSIVSVYGVQAHDLFWDIEHRTMEDAVNAYVADIKKQQPNGPYLLFGWSYGGALAYEIACKLNNMGDEIAYLAILDIPPKMGHNAKGTVTPWHTLAEPIFKQRLGESWPKVAALPEQQGIALISEILMGINGTSARLQQNVCRKIQYEINEARWFSDYQANQSGLDFDVFVSEYSEQQQKMKPEHGISLIPYADQWSQCTSGKVTFFSAKGSHMEMVRKPLVTDLIEQLKNRIEPVICHI